MSTGREKRRGRRTAAQPDPHDVRHRLDHRPAAHLGHGHGPGGLAELKDTVEIERGAAPGVGPKQVSGHRSTPCGRRRSCRTRIRSTSSRPQSSSASRSPRFLAGCSAPAVGGWLRSSSGQFKLKPTVPPRPGAVRPRELHEARQAADRRPRPLRRRLQERPPRRLPLGQLRPRRSPRPPVQAATPGDGASGEAADIYVRCETCDTSRPMSDAFKMHDSDLPVCRARRPHLRDFDESGCKDEQNQPIRVRSRCFQGASNSWFPVMLSALSIPQSSNLLKQLVDRPLDDLYDLESEADIAKMRRRNLLRDFSGVSDAEIWAAIQEKQAEGETATGSDVADLKTPEWEVFIDPAHAQKTPGLPAAGGACPRPLRQVLREDRPGRAAAGSAGTRRLHPDRVPRRLRQPGRVPRSPADEDRPWQPVLGSGQRDSGRGDLLPVLGDGDPELVGRVQRLDLEFFEAHKQWRKARGLGAARGVLSRACGTSCCTRSPTP